MAVNGVSSGTSLSELSSQILKHFDANGDGQLGGEEFGRLLQQLTGQFGLGSIASATGTSATTPAAAAGSASLVFGGFNFERAQDPQRSAKDAFAMLAKQAGVMPTTKAEAEVWFKTYIQAGMEALGHQINWVDGDKFSCTNWQGSGVVDFVANAGGENPTLAWQTEY